MLLLTFKLYAMTIAHPWCNGHSTSINACEVCGVKDWSSSLQEITSHTYTLRLD